MNITTIHKLELNDTEFKIVKLVLEDAFSTLSYDSDDLAIIQTLYRKMAGGV